jgi:hypothetical protein
MSESDVKYSEKELELLFKWQQKCGGWRWLHYHSMHLYKNINARFTYSSIVLSTLAGAGGFSTAGSVSDTHTVQGKVQFFMGYAIGVVNVIIGLINSFQRFGKAAEKTELHASAAMQYAMLYRKIQTELNLSDHHRQSDLIATCRQEMDRLLSQSPSIPQKIVDSFNKNFPDDPENPLEKPDVCNGLGSPIHKKLPSSFFSTPSTPSPTNVRGILLRNVEEYHQSSNIFPI